MMISFKSIITAFVALSSATMVVANEEYNPFCGGEEEFAHRELQAMGLKTLKAMMGKYPGYMEPLDPSSEVRVIFQTNGVMEIKMYTFTGMELSVTNAGFHIHAGTSCADASFVGPHYWDEDKVIDLWTLEGGAVYDTWPNGKPKGSFHVYNGYKLDENVGHAVVAYAADGTRVACGVLQPMYY